VLDIHVIEDPAAATVALEPVRSRLLSELAAPASAATLAARVGLARQKVNYHLNALEAHGLVRAAQTAARETPLWQAWFQERFPMPSETSRSE